MKIGMIVHAYYLRDARVRRYAELLSANGHEVDVICLREGDEPLFERHLGVGIHRIYLARARGGKLSYVLEYVSSSLRFFMKLNRLATMGRRYDVLHVHNMPDFLVLSTLLQRLSGTRVILDVHDLMSEIYQSKYRLESSHWLPRLLRIEESLSTKFASAIIAANHTFADVLAERGVPRAKITVVMNAAADQFFLSDEERWASRAAKKDGDFHVIYIGTMAPRYGVEIAVRAVAKLHREGRIPGLKFTIIPKIKNEGPYVNEVLAEIEDAGLGDRFTMMEPVPHDQMPAVIATADAMVYTPIPDVLMDIALSLKIPEAIAVGCPIVASRLSVNTRYFGDDALFVFEPGNVDDCAGLILDVYQNPKMVETKVARAKEKLEEIAWTKQATAYMELLDRLCANPVPRRELS